MIEIKLSQQDIRTPGLYLMSWRKNLGLARIVGDPKRGYQIINPDLPKETYFKGLPAKGVIPPDALFSEPLVIVVS